MTAREDFRQWEHELREPREERGVGWGLWAVLGALSAGCVGAIATGEAVLGICALVIGSVILVLWRSGM